VIKKLYAQPNDYVKTGVPLVDIDDGVPMERPPLTTLDGEAPASSAHCPGFALPESKPAGKELPRTENEVEIEPQSDAHIGPSIATPAVRGLLRELNIDIRYVVGTGKPD
jgi:2-oxoisovalerate dehydrogenase E2 component (dihydrolipoyl transacylase)